MYIRSFLLGLLTVALIVGLVGCDSNGSPANELGDSTSVSLVTTSDSIGEPAGSYTVGFTVSDPGFKSFSADFSISDTTGSVVKPESTTIAFEKSITDGETRTVTLDIRDDVRFTGDRTVTITLESATNASVGSQSSLALEIGEDETSIAQARSAGTGKSVSLTGVVTRFDDNGVYFQDPTGALYIFHAGSGDFANQVGSEIDVGTRVNISGTTGEFGGLFQLQKPSGGAFDFMIVDEDATVPEPQTVTLDDIATSGEQYEAELVRVENLSFNTSDDTLSSKPYNNLSDGSGGSIGMFVPGESEVIGKSIPSTAVYTGVVDVFRDNFQLYPLLADDITSQ